MIKYILKENYYDGEVMFCKGDSMLQVPNMTGWFYSEKAGSPSNSFWMKESLLKKIARRITI